MLTAPQMPAYRGDPRHGYANSEDDSLIQKTSLKQISLCISSQDTTQLETYIIPERMRTYKKGKGGRRKVEQETERGKKRRNLGGQVNLVIN